MGFESLAAPSQNSKPETQNSKLADPLSIFQNLPFEKGDLDPLFTPIIDALLQKLHQTPLLPAFDGSKVTIQNAYLAENKATQNLCDAAQLAMILGDSARWVFPDLSPSTKMWHLAKTHLTANKNTITADWLNSKLDVFKAETKQNTLILSENPIKTNILKAEVFEVYDTLSDEERLELMQEVEPNATYATWEEVQDFDVVGLADYLNQPISLESSLFLWYFLIDCLENKVFNINNVYQYIVHNKYKT